MTAQDLIDQVEQEIKNILFSLDAKIRQNYINRRKEILAGVQSMWDAASVTPIKSETTGKITYVSRAEANKYGRLTKLDESTKGFARLGSLADISALEFEGNRIYQANYNGAAWVYNQGYGLPVTGGAKVRLIAEALYSDYAGETFHDSLKKNWSKFYDDIISQVKRNLNAGKSYYITARDIRKITDSSYKRSLRIARTEGHRIFSMAAQDALSLLDSLGAEYKKFWISSVDDRTRRDHIAMDGKFADNSGIFHLPSGASGLQPGLTGNASDDINCRCSSAVSIDGELPTERRIRGEGIVPYETFSDRLARGGKIPSITAVRKAKQS